jgi:uncharacterized protein YhbP (UPF0306 family)
MALAQHCLKAKQCEGHFQYSMLIMAATCQVDSLAKLIDMMSTNPALAGQIKTSPQAVASNFGITLTTGQISALSSNLNVNDVLTWATQVNSYAAKVINDIGA